MTFTFPPMVAYDPSSNKPIKSVSFQVYAVTDTAFTTPLAITDTFNNPLAGNILNSGTQGVFPQFKQASNSTVVIADASRVYAWTVNCVQQDAAVAAFAADPTTATGALLTATYAPVPQAVKNPLTGYYHVRGFGGKGDITTTNDAVVNALIAQVIAAGGGTVYFDDDPFYTNPVYRIDQMVIYGQGDVNLEIKAAPNVTIKPAPNSTTDFITIASGATSSAGPFIRRVRFTDLAIQAQGYGTVATKINRRGIVISQAQDIMFRNVKISGFKQGALVLTDCWDSYFEDVEIKWSGYGTDNSNYAHALQFLGQYDNSNNNRFVNLHMEFCPLMMLFNNDARLNEFVNYKLEDGSETEKNTSTISPLYFKQALENTFTNGFATIDYTSDVPFITTDNNSASYSSTYNVRQSIKFSNSFFTANSLNKARWFSGYNTDFDNVNVQRANGASTAFVFDFLSRCSWRGGAITMADNGSNVFRLQLDGNIVETVNITTSGDGAAASTSGFTLSSGATRCLIRDYTITGSMGVEFIAGPTLVNSGNLGSNSVTNKRNNTLSTSGGGQKSVLYKDYVKLTDSSAATYTGFTYGCQGQRLTVFATTANVTLQHGTSANCTAMKSGANVTMAALETRNFVNIDGVWRET